MDGNGKKKQLLPCPFCGGVPIILFGYPHWVQCENCGAKVPSFALEEEAGLKECVAAWNRRYTKDGNRRKG